MNRSGLEQKATVEALDFLGEYRQNQVRHDCNGYRV
mgnify:FL=1